MCGLIPCKTNKYSNLWIDLIGQLFTVHIILNVQVLSFIENELIELHKIKILFLSFGSQSKTHSWSRFSYLKARPTMGFQQWFLVHVLELKILKYRLVLTPCSSCSANCSETLSSKRVSPPNILPINGRSGFSDFWTCSQHKQIITLSSVNSIKS